jgi:predicted nucleic acid-binding protein
LVDPAAGHTLYTVRLTGPEAVAALGRKVRTGELTQVEAASAMRAFRRAWHRRYRVVAATVAVAERAMDLAERHGLRGYDAVHLTAALAVSDLRLGRGLPVATFVTADIVQRQVAVAEGLRVDDPNAHP